MVLTLENPGTPVGADDLRIASVAMEVGVPIPTSDTDYLRIPQAIVDRIPD